MLLIKDWSITKFKVNVKLVTTVKRFIILSLLKL
jgi:hypothetical protein